MSATESVKLSDGRDVTVDISTLKVKEWRSLWRNGKPEEDEIVLARLCGLEAKDFPEMALDDYRRIVDAVRRLGLRPLDVPNSPSGSTTV